MITFRDPPPLQVRVESLKVVPEAPPKFGAPIGAWVQGMLLIAVAGIIGIWHENRDKGRELLAAAMSNALPRQAERDVLRVMPIGSDMRAVVKQLDDVHVTCRTTGTADSGMTCLGLPIVRANTYTRQRIRFRARDGKLAAVEACPVFVHWATTPVPDELAARVLLPPARDCWRDDTNPADNEWTFATLPDRAFTVAVVHGADSVSRKSAPTSDTLIVRW